MDHFELRAAMQQHRADMHARHNRIALLERQLREATADRDRSVERFVSFGEAHEAARHDTALRSIGRELGVTHRAVTGMVDRARTRAPHPTADAPLIPVLTAEQARAYVESGALGNLSRVHVAFNPNDIVLESGLDPSAFPDLGDRDAPNMLLFGDDGAVVGVEECLAGYGGTGPSNTVRLLRELGFPEQLREEVFHSRYLELTPTDVLRASTDSIHRAGGGIGLSTDGQHLVVRVPGGSATVADWTAEVLAEPTKYPWAAGTRRARVYLDRDAAAPLQEPYRAWRGTSSYSVIIEQGRLQLWVAAVCLARETSRATAAGHPQAAVLWHSLTWADAMEPYAAWRGLWHARRGTYRAQKLGGEHQAADDCRTLLERLETMAQSPAHF